MKRPVLSFLLLTFAAAYGQDSPPYHIGDGVSPPRVLSKQLPQYSEEARKAQLEGTVLLSLVVGEDGVPGNVSIAKGVGFGLDEEAIEAVSAWRFAPGQKEGKPVPVLTTIEVNFRLAGKAGRWHLTRAVFNPPAGASAPSVVTQEFPPDSPAQEPRSVTLTFDVDEHGIAINIHVEKSSDADSERDAIAAAREWRFNPGLKDGTPVTVPLTLEFSHGSRD
jgi:TonB family protein